MPTPSANEEQYQVIWLVRRLFRALGQKSDEMLKKQGITAADRAVMEFLYPDRTLAVPEIARRYDVSRQHVQVTVNPLIERGILVIVENPRHKRSPLIGLTRKGRTLFSKILERDKRAIRSLFEEVSSRDSHTTRRTLQALLTKIKEGETNENA